ncbi:MAG: 6-pyruvoyl-tetrahydropterin synthase-related protein, partial [Anaerolineae bacterium]
MRHALEQGVFFSRWLPDLAFGYGFPFFNYRAPLSYYLALGLVLAGLPLPLSFNLLYVLSLLCSALGAYLLAQDLFGPRAGVVAAVAYTYAPYQLLDALRRGNAPESIALALLPFLLWTFRRLALRGGRRWFLLSVGLLTALYLGHNISSLLFTPFLLAYLVTLWWIYRQQGHWRQTALAFALALGLTAFFWLPALAEREYVQLYLTGATRGNDFHYNFLGLAEIFAPPAPGDTSLLNPPMEIHLGLVQTALALLLVGRWAGLQVRKLADKGVTSVGLGAKDREEQLMVGFFAVAAALMIFMSTRASVWIWEHVPLLPFVQFPWRLVGRAALPIALLAGCLPAHTQRPRGRPYAHHVFSLAFYLAVAAIIVAALPSTYPPAGYCPQAPQPTIQDVHSYEHRSGLVGVDPVGAYFPVWVKERPQESPLEDQYSAEGLVERFDEAALPDGAKVLETEYGPNRAQLLVESPQSFHARYLSFYFPGWRAWVDGKRVEVTHSDPEGLIRFEVPAGRHSIRVRFGETPLRRIADAISAASLPALIVAIVFGSTSETSPRAARLESGTVGALLLIAGLLLMIKLLVVDRMETPVRRARLRADNTLPGVEHPLSQAYADGLTLIGYDQSAQTMPSDGTLRVDLYWTARHHPTRRYQTVVHLVGPDGLRWSPKDSFRPTDYEDAPPTTAWPPGRYALDSHEVIPLTGTPPGLYDVVLTVFDRSALTPLSVLNEVGQPAAPEFVLGQVELTAPRCTADPGAFDMRHRLDRRLGPLTLLGVNFSRGEAAPGDPILVSFFWRSESQPLTNLELELTLLSPDGSQVVDYELTPATAWHPTAAWQSGDIWRGQHLIHLPADLDGAEYRWQLSLLPIQRSTGLPTVVKIDAPEHTFTPPPVDNELDVQVGDVATLVGASFEPAPLRIRPGETFTTTLVWRAESLTH